MRPLRIGTASSVIPGYFQAAFRCIFRSGDGEAVSGLGGPDFVIHAGVVGEIIIGRASDVQGGVNGIENVAAEISDRATSKVLPIAPSPGVVAAMLR